MARWLLDLARLLVFCGLFLFAATALLAEETEDGESHSFGFKIEIEDGEVHVEKTGDGDLDELPEMIEGKIAEIIERISKDKNIQVRAKAIMNNGEQLLKELPVEGILESIGESIRASGSVDADVDIEMEEMEGDGHRRVEIREVIHGGDDDEDIMKVIKGLKGKIGKGGAKAFRWTSDGNKEERTLFYRDEEGRSKVTHRLGIHIGQPVGVSVGSVSEGSAAEAAGIQAGDVIVAVNGEKVGHVDMLIGMVNRSGKNGESMDIAVLRDGEKMTVSATPSEIEDVDEDEDEDHDEQGHGDHDHADPNHDMAGQHDGEKGTHDESHKHAHRKVLEQSRRHEQGEIKNQHKRVEVEVKRARAKERKIHDRAREMRVEAAAELQRSGGVIQELRSELAELREMVEGIRDAIQEDKE